MSSGSGMPGRRCGHGTGSPATSRIGTWPAQTSSAASSLSPSSGPPAEILAEASSSESASTAVALSSLRRRLARLLPAAGQHLLGERLQRAQLLLRLGHRPRLAEHDDRAVVDAHLEHRAREHHAVEQRDGEADRHRGAGGAQRPAGRRAVHVDLLAEARVQRGDHERLALVGEADVRHERLVEDGLDGVALVGRLLVHPAHAHALGRRGRAAAGGGGAHRAQDAA